jgi:hypothetical protein
VAPFYFTIGSVESFERKLEQVQRDMSIHPRDFIPVQYVNETNWAAELVSEQPTGRQQWNNQAVRFWSRVLIDEVRHRCGSCPPLC